MSINTSFPRHSAHRGRVAQDVAHMIRMPELESNGAPVQVECPAHRALSGCHAPDEGLAQVSLHGHRPDPHVLQGPQPGACVQLGSLLRVLPRILLRVLLKVLSRVLLSVLLLACPQLSH